MQSAWGRRNRMPDYALMNQHLYEGKAKEVEQMTRTPLRRAARCRKFSLTDLSPA